MLPQREGHTLGSDVSEISDELLHFLQVSDHAPNLPRQNPEREYEKIGKERQFK